ncbi:MAG: polysaccharide deacetylase family protein [Spirochaetaceae bacterium]|nr:polysaccharide deacetylase family protein [Spirochaetaceae bacterium]
MNNLITRMKHHLRSGLDLFAQIFGLLRQSEKKMHNGLTILMYHRVLPLKECIDYPLSSLVVPLDVFELQMKWLFSHHTVLPVIEAVERLEKGEKLEKSLVSVTFDDGYLDNYEHAAPIMDKLNLRGTFFITTGFVANKEPQWFDRAALIWSKFTYENKTELLLQIQEEMKGLSTDFTITDGLSTWMEKLKTIKPSIRMKIIERAESINPSLLNFNNYQPMTVDQIRALHKKNHEIASHTVSHQIVSQLDESSLKTELDESSKQLESWIGSPIKGFCYPNGNYTKTVEKTVLETGYEYACTVEEGTNFPGSNKTRLLRIPITMRRTMNGFSHDQLGFRAEISRLRARYRK